MARYDSHERHERRLVNISPGQVPAARHVIKFVAEVSVAAVGKKVDDNREQGEIKENCQVAKEKPAWVPAPPLLRRTCFAGMTATRDIVLHRDASLIQVPTAPNQPDRDSTMEGRAVVASSIVLRDMTQEGCERLGI